jgi:hypothetical protein
VLDRWAVVELVVVVVAAEPAKASRRAVESSGKRP